MDQRQPESDRNAGEPAGRTLRGRTDNDKKEKEGHHHFGQKASAESVFARAEIAIAISGKTARHPARLARGNQPQHRSGSNGSDNLGHDVGYDMAGGTSSGGPQANS